MIKNVIQESLEYLNALGPSRVVRLFSSLGMERVSYLTAKIEKKKILDTLKKSDINKSLKLMKPLSNDDIVLFMRSVRTSDLIYIIKNLDINDIEAWNRAVPVRDSHRIIEALGTKKAVHLLNNIGGIKAGAVWKELKTKEMLAFIDSLGYRKSAYLGSNIPLYDIQKWLKKKGTADIPILVRDMGERNLVHFVRLLGIEKCIKVLDVLKPEEIILLTRQMKGMSYPKLNPGILMKMKKKLVRKKKDRGMR